MYSKAFSTRSRDKIARKATLSIRENFLLAVKKSKSIYYLEMTEGTNSMRSANSVEKVDFAWSGFLPRLLSFLIRLVTSPKIQTKKMKNVFRAKIIFDS